MVGNYHKAIFNELKWLLLATCIMYLCTQRASGSADATWTELENQALAEIFKQQVYPFCKKWSFSSVLTTEDVEVAIGSTKYEDVPIDYVRLSMRSILEGISDSSDSQETIVGTVIKRVPTGRLLRGKPATGLYYGNTVKMDTTCKQYIDFKQNLRVQTLKYNDPVRLVQIKRSEIEKEQKLEYLKLEENYYSEMASKLTNQFSVVENSQQLKEWNDALSELKEESEKKMKTLKEKSSKLGECMDQFSNDQLIQGICDEQLAEYNQAESDVHQSVNLLRMHDARNPLTLLREQQLKYRRQSKAAANEIFRMLESELSDLQSRSAYT